jgi:hypothetical protein
VQHIGILILIDLDNNRFCYSYEFIGVNNPFFVERMDLYARAIEYFELSHKVFGACILLGI